MSKASSTTPKPRREVRKAPDWGLFLTWSSANLGWTIKNGRNARFAKESRRPCGMPCRPGCRQAQGALLAPLCAFAIPIRDGCFTIAERLQHIFSTVSSLETWRNVCAAKAGEHVYPTTLQNKALSGQRGAASCPSFNPLIARPRFPTGSEPVESANTPVICFGLSVFPVQQCQPIQTKSGLWSPKSWTRWTLSGPTPRSRWTFRK